MKSQKPMHALLAAFLLLVGISSTDAALCSATAFVGTVTTCDCPVGTAPSGSYSSVLPTGVYGGATAGITDAGKLSQLTKANAALAYCVDLLPGYKKSTGDGVMPTACVISDGYCPGYVGAFAVATAANQIVVTSTDHDAVGYTLLTGTFVAKTGGAALAFTQKTVPIVCPANSGGVNTAQTDSAAGPASTGQVAPFTIDKCKVTDGYYVAVEAGAATASVLECPLYKVCTTGTHAGSPAFSLVNCVTTDGVNDDLTPGGFFCPIKTYGALGLTLAASLSSITGEKPCGAGSGPMGASATTCDVLPGFYGTNSIVGLAMTPCPTGITGNGGATLAAACTAVAPGYEILTAIPAQVTPGPITALTAGITACAGENKICLGTRTVAITGTSEALATFEAVAVSTPSTDCVTGTGNTLTGAAAQGVNAKSYATACVDLLPGYSMAAQSADDDISLFVTVCTTNHYKCAGYAGLFVNYATAAARTALKTATGVEPAAAGNLVIKDANDFIGNVVTAGTTGSLMQTNCGGFSISSGTGALIGSCLTKVGYYVDDSALSAGTACAADKYCPGGNPLGVAGGLLNCPTGSTAPATGGILNNNINACTVNEGFYIHSGAVATPVPCLASNICSGGGPVGTAGGSVACPTGSTHTACVGSTSSTTVNLTPASQPITVDVAAPTAAAAPSVTVTNTAPSASSAGSTVASMVVVAVAAMVAL